MKFKFNGDIIGERSFWDGMQIPEFIIECSFAWEIYIKLGPLRQMEKRKEYAGTVIKVLEENRTDWKQILPESGWLDINMYSISAVSTHFLCLSKVSFTLKLKLFWIFVWLDAIVIIRVLVLGSERIFGKSAFCNIPENV